MTFSAAILLFVSLAETAREGGAKGLCPNLDHFRFTRVTGVSDSFFTTNVGKLTQIP